jgi:hypothetical protein
MPFRAFPDCAPVIVFLGQAIGNEGVKFPREVIDKLYAVVDERLVFA